MADGGIRLIARDPADVSTPPADTVTIFPDATDGNTPAFKDETGTTTSFVGSSGPTGPGYGGTSTTSLAIGTGSKAFTTSAGLAYVAGSRVRAASDADPDNDWMEGVVASYVTTTLTVTVDLTSGSGTHTDWNLSLAGEPPSVWLGPWSAGTYQPGDAVSNNGSSYVANTTTTQEPPDTDWDVLAAGATGDLDAIITASSGQDIADALAGAAAPDSGNVFATMADVGGGGGPTSSAATNTVATDEATASTSYTDLSTSGPAVTVTVNTMCLVIVSCRTYGGSGWYARMSFAASSSNTIAASDANACGAGESPFDDRVSTSVLLTGLTPGSTVFTAKYKALAGTPNFLNRTIIVIPLD